MKITDTWIRQYLDKDLSAHEIADALERSGVEVEQIDYPNRISKGVVVGLVNKVVQHPNADRLRLALVTVGDTDLHIVCGAPNVKEGMKVAVALPGTELPGGFVIKTSKIRGEVSEGMLCSEKELGLGESHEGILELQTSAAPGAALDELTDAPVVLHIKTAANRPDMQSAIGIAREVAAFTDSVLRLPEGKDWNNDQKDTLIGELDKGVSRFVLATLSVDSDAVSPAWLVEKLETVGLRSLGPVVDVTNYVMFEWGQPLHAYDASKVSGPIGVRRASADEKFKTLDGRERQLNAEDLVVADQNGAIGLAGVMGGAESEVTPESRTIILEAAVFDGALVRKTALRQGLRSEASARFERGLPVQLPPLAMGRAIRLLEEIAGAQLESVEDKLSVWPWIQRIGLRRSDVSRLLGVELESGEIVSTLRRVGIEARPFDIVSEAKKHLGKPYRWGARFREDGTDAFDCGYLVDYLYSLIGKMIGHSAPQLMKSGTPVELSDLRPGDTFYRDGAWKEVSREERDGVSHVAMYIGDGQIIHAENYHLVNGEWQELPKDEQKVRIDPMEVITEAPGFYGARRHVENLDDYIAVEQTPWWRPDLKEPADLIEEIVRLIGYERIPSTLPAWRPETIQFDRERRWLRQVRETMYALGAFEVYTYSFVSKRQLEGLSEDPKNHLKLANPLSSEQEYLRRSPLPSLLAAVGRNEALRDDFGLYEVTSVFEPKPGGGLPDEPRRLALIWRRPGGSYGRVKGALDLLGRRLELALDVAPVDANPFEPGRSAEVRHGRRVIGRIGQVGRRALAEARIKGEVSYLELDLDALLELARPTQYAAPSRFPTTSRDIALVMPLEVTWAQVRQEIVRTGLASPVFLSEYRGEGIPEGKKSLAIRLVMSDPERTLTDDEAAASEEKIVEMLGRIFKASGRA